MKKLVLIALFFILLLAKTNPVFAQSEILSNNPPRVDWFQINTPKFQVIFQDGFGREARRAANTLQHLSQPVSKTLLQETRKIAVVLQNRNAISNGFVTITPRRSEFYTMPPQDYNFLGNNDWIDLLAVHEYRHVVQFDKSITGFNKLLFYAFGAPAVSAMSFMAVPQWFWEGDAVATETALTQGGRGRIPNFDMVFRTNLLEDRKYDYAKQHLRSFKDYVPNHYVLGYLMTTHLRRHHAAEIWARVTERAFRKPYIPFTFSRALNKETGKNLLQTYQGMMSELDSLWTHQLSGLKITDALSFHERQNKAFTNYQFPQQLSDGRVVALKSGMGDIQQFISFDSAGNEKVEFIPGIMNVSGMLSLEADKLVWNEYAFDPRWRAVNYSIIKMYDFKEKEIKNVTSRSRYTSAALSPDGQEIVTLHVSESNDYRLVILDAENGQVILTLPNPKNFFYAMPRFSDDGEQILAVKQTSNGKTISLFSRNTQESIDILPITSENIGHPVMYKNHVFYNASYRGIDNIYVTNLYNDKIWQVTSRKYGAFNPVISEDGESIIFNDYQKNGMNVAFMPFDTAAWVPLKNVEGQDIAYYQPLVEQEQHENILGTVPDTNYPIKKYNKLKNSFNPYAWGPLVSVTDRQLLVGFSSQDVLSTTALSAGYVYNANENSGYGFGQASYQGLFSIIDLNARLGNRSILQTFPDTTATVTWNEKSLGLGFRLPLVLTKSKYYENLSLQTNTALTEVTNYSLGEQVLPNQQADGILHAFSYRAAYSRLLKRSQRDLNSKFGQTVFAQYTHTPLGGSYKSSLFAAEGNLFFPGLFKHHSLHLRGGFQHENAENYTFSTPLFFPRGFGSRSFRYFYNASIQYRLPLFYPDVHLGPAINLQRVKANLFYDYGKGTPATGNDRIYHSLGLDITTDFNIMRFFPLFEMGVRYLYLPQTNTYSFQLLIGQFGF